MIRLLLYISIYALLLVSSIVAYSQDVQVLFTASERLSNCYGVCAHISRKDTDYPCREKDLKLMNDARISWVRTDFDYWCVGNTKGNFNPCLFDSMMVSTTSAGVKMLGILDRHAVKYAWNDMAAYEDYVRFVVDRYKNRIGAWEMMNEVDLIKNHDSLDVKYAQVARYVYPLIKQIDSSAIVLLSGIANPMSNFLEKLEGQGVLDCCDVLNIHSYASPETNLRIFRSLNDKMKRWNVNKPIWLTECGMHTAYEGEYSFYDRVLPIALSKLNMEQSNISCAIISDSDNAFYSVSDDEVKRYFEKKFASVKQISLDEIKKLDVATCPILIPTSGEEFPMIYFDDIQSYMRKGGTIILPYGIPFYYDYDLENKQRGRQVGEYYISKLGVNVLTWWSDKGKQLYVPERSKWLLPAEDYNVSFASKKYYTTRFLTDDGISYKDEFIPLVYAGDDNYKGVVTALYKFENKGNIIVNVRMDETHYVDKEKEQAKRIARNHLIAFACGIDKVFTYNLRANEKDIKYSEDNFGILHHDFKPKPSYNAYRVLTQMLPDGSTRPTLYNEGDVYIATWHSGEKNILAIWTNGYAKTLTIETNIEQLIDYNGRQLNMDRVNITDGVIFIVSNSPILCHKVNGTYVIF